nr:hypothetical protein [Pyrinomonadaceae bacterium]
MKEDVNTELLTENKTDRRKFLGKIGKAAVGITAATTIVPYLEPKAKIFGQNRSTIPGFDPRRSGKCMQIRKNAAEANYLNTSSFPRANNGDESLYPNKIGSYSKGLPHQANGEVNLQAYYALTDALAAGSPAGFEQIPMGGDRKL